MVVGHRSEYGSGSIKYIEKHFILDAWQGSEYATGSMKKNRV